MNNDLKKKISNSFILTPIYLWFKYKLRKKIESDKKYLLKSYIKTHHISPDLDNPVTFSEKLLWSMLNHRDNLFVKCADKYEVREYVKNKIGEKYLINILGLFSDVNEIDFDKLPLSFVLKATHSSGWIIIIKDKKNTNKNAIRRTLKYWLKTNYYDFNREWTYNYMKKQIICEEFIGNEEGKSPLDYKFFCFNGEPKLIQLDIDRFSNHKRNVYDIQWNQIKNVEIAHEQDYSKEYEKPKNLEEMLNVASKLSEGFKHVRIDLYNLEGKIYFGEMTFFHGASVFDYFKPYEFHKMLGDWFQLPEKNINEWSFE